MKKNAEFFEIIKKGDLNQLTILTNEDPSLISARNEDGASAILFSLYSGQKLALELLLKSSPVLDIFEATALNESKQLSLILAKDPDLIHTYSSDGFTPLHLACYFGRVASAKILIESKAEVNLNSKNGAELKPINCAAASRDLDSGLQIVELLLKSGADLKAAQRGGYTSLHSAAANGNIRLVKLLLSKGADPNALSADNKSALDFAKERNQTAVIRLLELG